MRRREAQQILDPFEAVFRRAVRESWNDWLRLRRPGDRRLTRAVLLWDRTTRRIEEALSGDPAVEIRHIDNSPTFFFADRRLALRFKKLHEGLPAPSRSGFEVLTLFGEDTANVLLGYELDPAELNVVALVVSKLSGPNAVDWSFPIEIDEQGDRSELTEDPRLGGPGDPMVKPRKRVDDASADA